MLIQLVLIFVVFHQIFVLINCEKVVRLKYNDQLTENSGTIRSNTHSVNSNIDFSSCRKLTTKHGYGYKNFFEISNFQHHSAGYILDLHFAVQAPGNAHVLLTPTTKTPKNAPVYEIVLGGGDNTFSNIRRKQLGGSKGEAKTMNLLSIHEMKSFWLHFSNEGLLEVGEEGEEIAFISWKDPDPIPIRYVSFGTWANVEASWRFDCLLKTAKGQTSNNTNEAMIEGDTLIEVPENLTSMERLRLDLFSNYDPYVIPAVNQSQKLALLVNIQRFEIGHLDEIKSTLTAQASGNLKWYDHKLRWTPSAYGNITSVKLDNRETWIPELHLYNSKGRNTDIISQFGQITIWYNGLVQWTPKLLLSVWCQKSDLRHWPYDTRQYEFNLGLLAQSTMVEFSSNSSIAQEGIRKLFSEWQVTKATFFYIEYSGSPWIPATETIEDYTVLLKLEVNIRRNNRTLSLGYFSILFAIGVSMLLTSFAAPIGFSKISLICFQILLAVALLLAFSLKIPSSDVTPKIVTMACYSLVASCVLLFVATITICIEHAQHLEPLNEFICSVLSNSTIQMLLFLPNIKDCSTYDQFKNTEHVETKSIEIKAFWLSFSIFIDRTVFLLYTIVFAILIFEHNYLV